MIDISKPEIYKLDKEITTLYMPIEGRVCINGFNVPDSEVGRANLAYVKQQIELSNPNYRLMRE